MEIYVLKRYSYTSSLYLKTFLEQFSTVCRKESGNYFGFGFTTVWDWLSSLIGK